MLHRGDSFGKYKLVRRIGVGGMAEVWLARFEGPGGFSKKLVLKTVLERHGKEEEFIAQLLDEARLAALLNHPNIAQIFELDSKGGTYFIAMEYVRGKDLHEILERAEDEPGGLPFPYLARIVCGLCAGLHYAHELADENGAPLNLVHRDISPENILVSYDGITKLVDFGIAKATINQVTTQAGMFKGKLQFAAPQRFMDEPPDRRDDIYSLGALLYRAVVGHPPVDAESDGDVIQQVLDGDITPPGLLRRDLPAELEKIILKCIAWEPNDRYRTAREVQNALERFVADGGSVVTPFELAEFMKESFAEDIVLEAKGTASDAPTNDDSERTEPMTPTERDDSDRMDAATEEELEEEEEEEDEPPSQSTEKEREGKGKKRPKRRQEDRTSAAPDDEPSGETPAPSTESARPSEKSRGRMRYWVTALFLVVLAGVGIGMSGVSNYFRPARPRGIGDDNGKTSEFLSRLSRSPSPMPSRAGAREAVGSDNAEPGAEEEEILDFVDFGHPWGTLALSGPDDCTASSDRKTLGSLPLRAKMPIGKQSIRINCSRNVRRSVNVEIEQGKVVTEAIELEEGTLVLKVRPWAEVFIDGRSRGITPMGEIRLQEGWHWVRVVNDELNVTKRTRVDIRPGEQTKLRFRLR